MSSNPHIVRSEITRQAIEVAAENYYEKVVSKFFDIATHSLMSFSEKVSELQQKELLDLVVSKLKSVKRQISSGEFSGLIYNKERTNPYCSHFHFQPNLEHFLRTLELNFFVTKYNEMVNKKGVKVSIYGLNYGLSKSQNLRWGDQTERSIELISSKVLLILIKILKSS